MLVWQAVGRLTAAAILVVSMWLSSGPDVEPVVQVPSSTVYVHPVPEERVVAPLWVAAPDSARCGMWWQAAQQVGWPADLLSTLDEVMWRESRCLEFVVGNGGYGLVQVQWSVHEGWLSEAGIERDMLLEPLWNLYAGWLLFQRAEASSAFRCGWSPWYPSTPPSVDHWCDF